MDARDVKLQRHDRLGGHADRGGVINRHQVLHPSGVEDELARGIDAIVFRAHLQPERLVEQVAHRGRVVEVIVSRIVVQQQRWSHRLATELGGVDPQLGHQLERVPGLNLQLRVDQLQRTDHLVDGQGERRVNVERRRIGLDPTTQHADAEVTHPDGGVEHILGIEQVVHLVMDLIGVMQDIGRIGLHADARQVHLALPSDFDGLLQRQAICVEHVVGTQDDLLEFADIALHSEEEDARADLRRMQGGRF